MKSTSVKFIIFFIFITFYLNSIETKIIDTVNVRKLFFLEKIDWDKYVNKKNFFENKQIGLVVSKTIPETISKNEFNSIISMNLHNVNDIKLLQNNYLLINKITNNYDAQKQSEIRKVEPIYKLLQSSDEKTRNTLYTILLKTGFNKFDYNMAFYPNYLNLKQTDTLNDSLTYQKIAYKFDYENKMISVTFFYQENNSSYLFFEKDNPDKFDVYQFGVLFKKNQNYHYDFEALKYLPSETFLSFFKDNKIDKETVINKDDFVYKDNFINKIILPSVKLNYNDDGAIDDVGDFIYISTEKPQIKDFGINCSGFVKDVIDNYIRDKYPDFKWLSVNDLKEKSIKYEKTLNYEIFTEKYDPLFGLDWVNNLAKKINYLCNLTYDNARPLDNDNLAKYYGANGYEFIDIKDIIFRDQKKSNNYFYIIIFNKLGVETPVIYHYYHIAIVVPYFKNYHFYTRVFESADETSFENLEKFHKGEKAVIYKIPIL